MKYCKNCGSENNDDNQFCFNCRCENFTDQKPQQSEAQASPFPSPVMHAPNGNPVPPAPPMPGVPPVNPNMSAGRPPQMPPYAPVMQQPVYQRPQKKPLTIADLLTILGFVAALVGMFSASVILHPLAAISSLFGFIKGTKFKPLSVAGFVISIVGGLVYIILSLHRSGLLPDWVTFGAFH